MRVEPLTHRLQPVDPRSFEFIEAQTGPEASWWFNHAVDRNHRFLGCCLVPSPIAECCAFSIWTGNSSPDRSRETAKVDRARRAMDKCIAEGHMLEDGDE